MSELRLWERALPFQPWWLEDATNVWLRIWRQLMVTKLVANRSVRVYKSTRV